MTDLYYATTSRQVLDRLLDHELLPHDEIEELIKKAQAGDKEAMDTIIRNNYRLVFRIAYRYHMVTDFRAENTLEDLMQWGVLGLMRAVELFNPKLGYKFSTYATVWCRQAIQREVSRNTAIKSPYRFSNHRNNIGKARAVLTQKEGRDPTLEELANKTGIPLTTVETVVLTNRPPLRLDQEVESKDGELDNLHNHLEDPDAPDPVQEAEAEDTRRMVREVMGELEPRLRRILEMRFGFREAEEVFRKDVGKVFGVSRERIRQLEAQALEIVGRKLLQRGYRF